jgi:hypothetical protein
LQAVVNRLSSAPQGVRDRGDSAKMPFEFPLSCCCIP